MNHQCLPKQRPMLKSGLVVIQALEDKQLVWVLTVAVPQFGFQITGMRAWYPVGNIKKQKIEKPCSSINATTIPPSNLDMAILQQGHFLARSIQQVPHTCIWSMPNSTCKPQHKDHWAGNANEHSVLALCTMTAFHWHCT